MFPLGLEAKLIGGVVLFALLLTGYGLWHHKVKQEGVDEFQAAHVAADLKATQAARQTEANWQTNVEALDELHQTEVSRIAAARDSALRELRNRPTIRLDVPAPAGSAPSGGTGAGLSGPDAGFLDGEATRANSLRAALNRCQQWISEVKRAP